MRNFVLHLNIITKSETWIFSRCWGLGHESMVCTLCIAIFLSLSNSYTQLTYTQDMPPHGVFKLYWDTSCIIHTYMTCPLFHTVSSSHRDPLRTCINRSPIYIHLSLKRALFYSIICRLCTHQVSFSSSLIAMTDNHFNQVSYQSNQHTHSYTHT